MCFVRLSLLFCFFSMLAACTSGPSEDEFAPKIGEINTRIMHFHPSAYEHKPETERRTIGFIIRASVTDPDGLGNITEVYIKDSNHDPVRYRILKNNSTLNEDADCKQTDEVIECSFYYSDFPDEMPLTGYELVAVDLHTYKSSKAFEFKLPAGEEVELEEFVYSDSYLGGAPNGIAGLEVMSITGSNMLFTLDDLDEGPLHLEFEVTDSRAVKYGVSLYDNTEARNLVGQIPYNAPSIQAAQIVEDGITSVDIPLTEIDFEDGFNVSDIYGLHVVLFDQPVASSQLEVQSNWFNYSGYSEFITLNPQSMLIPQRVL